MPQDTFAQLFPLYLVEESENLTAGQRCKLSTLQLANLKNSQGILEKLTFQDIYRCPYLLAQSGEEPSFGFSVRQFSWRFPSAASKVFCHWPISPVAF